MAKFQLLLAAMVTLAAIPIMLCSNVNTFEQTGGCDCPSRHPQQKFCDESLVVRGTVHHIGRAESTHHDAGGGMNMDMLIEVYVNKVFKGNDSIQVGSRVFVHTYGMCRFEMMLRVGHVYVISANDVYQPGYYVILRGCSWVQKWNSLTRDQINGLQGAYHDCHLCEITKSLTPYNIFDEYSFLEEASPSSEGDQPIGACFHNQQMAMTMRRYQDCETLYSACVVRDNDCEWLESREYRKCMKKRNKGLKKGGKKQGGKHIGGPPGRQSNHNHFERGRGETTG